MIPLYLDLHIIIFAQQIDRKYMTTQGTCHFDANLTIVQQADAKIYNYAKDISF
jgi:hypothetical protein